MLFTVLKAGEGVFQTGWFVESVLSEIIILFIMRTKKPFLKSKPSRWLLWLSIAAMLITITLPWWPHSGTFEMSRLAGSVLLGIFVVIVLYTITADWLKIWFFKRMAKMSNLVH